VAGTADGTAAAVVTDAVVAPAVSAVPHSLQNFPPGAFGAPQAGQSTVSAVPHSLQNFAPSGFLAPQLEQMFIAG
jgi:hypothetical protein